MRSLTAARKICISNNINKMFSSVVKIGLHISSCAEQSKQILTIIIDKKKKLSVTIISTFSSDLLISIMSVKFEIF